MYRANLATAEVLAYGFQQGCDWYNADCGTWGAPGSTVSSNYNAGSSYQPTWDAVNQQANWTGVCVLRCHHLAELCVNVYCLFMLCLIR